MLEIKFAPKKGIWADEPETLEKLRKNFFGSPVSKKKQGLEIEEALYLIGFQNAVCRDSKGKMLDFNKLASFFVEKEHRLFVKYNAYRDWRDRGLIVKRVGTVETRKAKGKSMKRYPMRPFRVEEQKAKTVWYHDSLFSVLDKKSVGKFFFEDFWLGQLGVYKQERGELLKLDSLETVFVARHFGIKVIDAASGKKLKPEQILKQLVEKREYAKQLYEVYEDWMLRGYVVKTGFKFGSHFRIYFPGSSPVKQGKWVHSKHVLHIFPKEQKLLISEWSRAVRVAHGVKKTFILSIPEMRKKDYVEYPADFIAYRRKKVGRDWVRESPEDKPRYLLVPVAEDEHIGGVELASLLKKAQDMGLELLLSITDRETAITYYVLKRVVLPGSKYEYYEIEWMKP